MSLTIDTGITARTPNPSLHNNLPTARKDRVSSVEDPALVVTLPDALAQSSQEAAASAYNVTSLRALKQNFYKASIG